MPGDNRSKSGKRKIPTEVGIIIMDGLVSTGKKIPYTILKIIFAI